jgi:RND family efflux transporter MFP subunit
MADSDEKSAPKGEMGERSRAVRTSAGPLLAKLSGGPTPILAVVGAVLLIVVLWFASRPPVLEVATIRLRTVDVALSVVGRVRPIDLVDVRSPNPGQLVRVYKDEGDVVAAGAPLAVVKAEVEQAQAEAFLAREAAARAEAERTRLAYERTRTLADKGFASPAALDNVRAELRSAEASLAAASAERRAASSRTGEFTIKAPMAGVVLLRPVDNGQVVSPETTLFQLGSQRGVEIEAEVDEAYADALQPDMQARAALSGTDTQFAARITEVSPRIDVATGGRLVKLRPEEDLNIPPGRTVDVTIVVERRPDTIVVPRQAVVDAASGPQVYVVDGRGAISARSVRILDWPSLNAIVEQGLTAGDRVVLAPTQTRPGVRVRAEERAVSSFAQER